MRLDGFRDVEQLRQEGQLLGLGRAGARGAFRRFVGDDWCVRMILPTMEEGGTFFPDLRGEANSGAYLAQTADNASVEPSLGIFPIVRFDDQNRMYLLGTGFFITTNGLFATAKHVLQDALEPDGNQKYPIGLIQFLPGGRALLRRIPRCVFHKTADVVVGVAAPTKQNGVLITNPVLTLTSAIPAVGSRIVTYAHPKHINLIEENSQAVYFSGAYYDGTLDEHLPNGRDKVLLPGPCYRTSIIIHRGASGGPVFFHSGKVFGINSTGFDGDDVSYVSRINEIFDLFVENISIDGCPRSRVSIGELIRAGHIVVEP